MLILPCSTHRWVSYTYLPMFVPIHPSILPLFLPLAGPLFVCLSNCISLWQLSPSACAHLCFSLSVSLLVSDSFHVSVSFSKYFFRFPLHTSASVCGSDSRESPPLTILLWLSLSVFSVQVSLYVSVPVCLCFSVYVSPLHTCLSVSACVCIFCLFNFVSHLCLCLRVSVCTQVPLSPYVSFPSPPNPSLSVSLSVSSLCFSYSGTCPPWVSGCVSFCVYLCMRLSVYASIYVSVSFSLSLPSPPYICVSFLCLGFFLWAYLSVCISLLVVLSISSITLWVCVFLSLCVCFPFSLQYLLLCAFFSFSLCLFCRMWVFLCILPSLCVCVHACVLVLICFCLIHWLEQTHFIQCLKGAHHLGFGINTLKVLTFWPVLHLHFCSCLLWQCLWFLRQDLRLK